MSGETTDRTDLLNGTFLHTVQSNFSALTHASTFDSSYRRWRPCRLGRCWLLFLTCLLFAFNTTFKEFWLNRATILSYIFHIILAIFLLYVPFEEFLELLCFYMYNHYPEQRMSLICLSSLMLFEFFSPHFSIFQSSGVSIGIIISIPIILAFLQLLRTKNC